MAIAVGFIVSIGLLIIVIIIVLAFFYSRQRRIGAAGAATSPRGVKNVAIGKVTPCTRRTRSFSFDEVRASTTNFRHKIGEGRFGPVYSGKLPDGQEVAVKVRPTNYAQGGEQDGHLITEVHVLAKIHHQHLVSLLGYCLDPTNQVLIYEFMRNGTLRSHLHRSHVGKGPLMKWRTRVVVMMDAARGLQSLHTDWNPVIIHRDFSSINVMLNENMNGKVADFGVSKITLDDDSGIPTLLKCTAGYLDPEYDISPSKPPSNNLYIHFQWKKESMRLLSMLIFQSEFVLDQLVCSVLSVLGPLHGLPNACRYFTTQKLTPKSDVYSFGVVLLEIISGRPPIMYSQDGNQWSSLVEWAKSSLKGGKVQSIVDPSLHGLCAEESVRKVAELALSCVEFHGPKRPDMEKILLALADALHVEDTHQQQLLATIASIPSNNINPSLAKTNSRQVLCGVSSTPSSVSGFSFPRS